MRHPNWLRIALALLLAALGGPGRLAGEPLPDNPPLDRPPLARAPLDRAYRDWLARRRPRGVPGPLGGSKEGGLRVRGRLPHPVDLSHLKGPVFRQGLGDPPLPPVFDLRAQGRLTPVKDQGRYGTCWSFACMGSLESSLLKGGLGCFDLSEWHLAYFAYHPEDPPRLPAFTAGVLADWADPVFDQGGSDLLSVALLGRGTGAVAERDAPYHPGRYRPGPRPGGDLPNGREKVRVPLEQAMFLFSGSTEFSQADMKYALTRFGPTVIAMDWEDDHFDEGQSTFRDPQAQEFRLNHEVCVVGWDDSFDPARFPAGNRPSAPGAWIVRNSWGQHWGQGGYFYLSYDSKLFDGVVYRGGTRACRRIYQYDPLGWCGSRGFGTATAFCANRFQAAACEKITAVAFYAGAVGTRYELRVLPEVDGAPDPAWAEAGPVQRGTLQAPGFHVVDLERPATVRRGASFAVVLKLTTPGYNYPIPIQDQEDGYSNGAQAHARQGYISSDGVHWQDLAPGDQGASLCLKALADAR